MFLMSLLEQINGDDDDDGDNAFDRHVQIKKSSKIIRKIKIQRSDCLEIVSAVASTFRSPCVGHRV